MPCVERSGGIDCDDPIRLLTIRHFKTQQANMAPMLAYKLVDVQNVIVSQRPFIDTQWQSNIAHRTWYCKVDVRRDNKLSYLGLLCCYATRISGLNSRPT